MDIFDIHCDTLYECFTKGKNLYDNDLDISLKKGGKYNRWCQVFAIWIPDEYRGKAAVELCNNAADFLKQQIEQYKQHIRFCSGAQDLMDDDSRCLALLAVEGGAALGGTIEGIRHLKDMGVKLLTLTWNGENEIGCGSAQDNLKGLTDFGKLVLGELERLKIVIDVSHLNDAGFYDVAQYTRLPFVASHSNSRLICPHHRNLTDEQFKTICARGGLVGINFYPVFLNLKEQAELSDILKHIEHFLSLGGEKNICLGSDFDGADMPQELDSIDKLERLAEFMLRHNYSEALVKDIFYNNARSFFIKALT